MNDSLDILACNNYISINNEMKMKNSTRIFKALSDFNRLRILKALQSKILCVCEIRSLLNLANSTVSQHLKVLKEAGFIVESKSGKWVNYSINQNPSDQRVSSVLSALDYWIGDEDTIIADKMIIKDLCRDEICSI